MDSWDQGDSYERFMGRWSRAIAPRFLDWLAVAPQASWLDVGCGTGALSAAIRSAAAPAAVTGIDPSPAFADTARAALGDGADVHVGDAQSLPFADDRFDATVSGLVLNFVPQPLAALQEMRRVTRPGGVVGVYVWDYAGGMELLRVFWKAAGALDPKARSLDEGTRFPLCEPRRLGRALDLGGLVTVSTTALELEMTFASFDDYWQPFLGGQGPAPTYVATLSGPDRDRLAERIEQQLPVAVDGSITLTARAWAARGTA